MIRQPDILNNYKELGHLIMRIHIFSLFREMFNSPFSFGLLKRAVSKRLLEINIHNIRDYSRDSHHTVDDYSYGGGSGMVLKPEPISEAVHEVLSEYSDGIRKGIPVLLLSPQGKLFTQEMAEQLAQKEVIALICGRYGGVDERIGIGLATEEISVGDYVLSGGELPAMIVVESVARLIPGVVGSEESVKSDSITSGLLQHPLYTRPFSYQGLDVPSVLLSGDHKKVDQWRREQSLLRTLRRRPDLLQKADLSNEDLDYLRSQGYDNG